MEDTLRYPLNSVSAPLGTHNAVLRARARRHVIQEFPGPLSIKSVTEGAVAWKTGGRDLVVDRDSFLVLHDGEPYSMEIDSLTPVSTLCVFFQRGFLESVYASLAREGLEPDMAPAPLFARQHARDTRILPRMQAIADAGRPSRMWLDEQFLDLAADLLLLNRDIRRRMRLLPARRPATREELFRRARRAQELLHARASDDLDLAQVARAACLSPFHFHRAFTRAFGKTPLQYRNEIRLAQARRLLETTGKTVTEISGEVGFQSPASFSLLFRQSFGTPPSGVRKLSKFR